MKSGYTCFFFPLLNIQKLYNKLLEGETTAKTNKQ